MLTDIRESDIKLYRNGTAVAFVTPIGRSHSAMVSMSHEKRTFKKNKRRIVSSAVSLWEKKRRTVQFLTFTFAFYPDEIQANKIFTNVLKNLRTNYECNNYLWIKERQNNGRIHYHILLDGRFIHPKHMQKIFNLAVIHFDSSLPVSNNSVRYGPTPIVKDVRRLARYLAKYCAKSKDETFYKPCCRMSDEITDFARPISFEELEKIVTYFGKFKTIELSYSIIILTNYIDCKKDRERLGFSP